MKDGGDKVTNLGGGSFVGAGQISHGWGLFMGLDGGDVVGGYEVISGWNDMDSGSSGVVGAWR